MYFKKKSLSEKIFETLRDRIVYLDYPPKMSLSEKDLCNEFKVSRSPLREAIQKLEDMKLVTERVIELGDKKEILTKEDLPYIISDVLRSKRVEEKIRIRNFQRFISTSL